MRFSLRSRMSSLLLLVSVVVFSSGFVVVGGWATSSTAHATTATATHLHLDCSTGDGRCTDIFDSDRIFGHYAGHDEPATLFYSNVPGSGNRNSWQLTLPRDPSATNPLTAGKAYNFQLHIAFWFGMAICDTQSDPNQISTCQPDSDQNIVDPTVSVKHPGTAFLEMQFYPPGWAPFNIGASSGTSCDPTKWCAALNIDSVSDNPVTGQNNNPACAAAAGLEYVNFAFITKNGVPQGPPSPLLANASTFIPNPNKDLFMNSGDTLSVTMHDTKHGLRIDIQDQSSGQSGFMVASAANGFAQVKFDPNGTNCDPASHNLPYDFHPMYSTSSEKTNVTWAAHTYNIAFSDEIGHFDFCTGPKVITSAGSCPTGNFEGGAGTNQEPTDRDDTSCFPASSSLRIKVSGCNGINAGFDGQSYEPRWPDGNTKLHPTSILFSSPLTSSGYNVNYNRFAFEANLPAIESSLTPFCDIFTGAGCTLLPATDECFKDSRGNVHCAPADFYPFFSTRNTGGQCIWQLGNHIPGSTDDLHQNAQYGTLLQSHFIIPGGVISAYENFRQVFSRNACPA